MNATAPRRLASVTAALCLLAIVTGACPADGAAPREKASDEEPGPAIVETASGLRYQVLDVEGKVRERLSWPFSLPVNPVWVGFLRCLWRFIYR